jgi:transcriptional regulator with XRE-family HTH domain
MCPVEGESVEVSKLRDFEQLSVELLRAWRGSRSRAAFSRRLGASVGMVHNWEAKRRWPTAARAFASAERAGTDVNAAVRVFYGRAPDWLATKPLTTPAGVAALLSDWASATPVGEIARRAGRSRYAVARWLSGKAQPRLPDFLRLLEATSLRVIDFAAACAEPRQLPCIADEWQRLESARSLAYEAPWSHAVLRALELADYAALETHDEALLGRALGITSAQVRLCLQLLLAAGQITQTGGRYAVTSTAAVDTRMDPEANRRLKHWWAQVVLERMNRGTPGQNSFNLFSVSAADLERIRELQLRYFRELRQIVSDSAPAERVAVVSLHLLDLGVEAAR